MSALACIRILNDPRRVVAGVESPTAALRGAVGAFLTARWLPPRRFGEVAPGAFVLTEPTADHIDRSVLVALGRVMRHAPISLTVLLGDQSDITRFAALHPADLRAVVGGQMVVDGMNGDLGVIRDDGLHSVASSPDTPPLRLIMEGAPPTAPDSLRMAG